MGLDIYVGPLTRYHLGDWQTVVQQAAQAARTVVHVVRATPAPDDTESNPTAVRDAVLRWQGDLAAAHGVTADWREGAELPYWTDKPDWDGYGGVVLLAAYDEQPDAPRVRRTGMLRKRDVADTAREFGDAPAYQAASRAPLRYPSLLGGAEWWLPVSGGTPVFEAHKPNDEDVLMSSIEQLHQELRTLNERVLGMSGPDLESVRRQGSPRPGTPVKEVGRFGLAILLGLVELAVEHRQPLLMDY